MIRLSLGQLADVVGGEVAGDGADTVVDDVTIDSRTVRTGSLFVALAGEHTDGHRFVRTAVEAGAAGAIVSADGVDGAGLGGIPGLVVVDDPADALLGLGAYVRREVAPKVVAVTGSSGKTTTKDLIRAAIGAPATGLRVVANVNSYNNELGVPLTCCRLQPDTDVLVAEVGARGVGHVAAMAAILEPDVAVVTNVVGAHLEMFGDLDGVARAKGELVEGLAAGGVAVLNADDERVAAMATRAPGKVVTFGLAGHADVRATDVELDGLARPAFVVDGLRVRLPVPGRHNVANALAAIAAAEAAGVQREVAVEGLADASVSRWRMELGRTADGVTVLNDAYNANPTSVEAALRTLVALDATGRRWAVLGHMAELGAGGTAEHERIGRLVAELALDGLVVVGETAAPLADGALEGGLGRNGVLLRCGRPEQVVALLREHLRPGDVVLVKASRSVGLERVAAELTGGAAP